MEQIEGKKKTYFPGIDGLRAISFIIVFLFHCDLPFMAIGWAGIIIFFVISGFLITYILLNQKDRPHYFVNFFVKRLLRIAPIYFLLITSCVLFYYIKEDRVPNNYIFYFLNVQNILWVTSSSLTDLNGLLAHTWTLAIEEQFYLLWPFLIYSVSNKRIGCACVLLIVLAIIFRMITSTLLNDPLITSVLLPSQTDSLSLGGLFAYSIFTKSHNRILNILFKYSIWLGCLGLLLVLIALMARYEINVFHAYHLLSFPSKYLNNAFTSQIYFFMALIAVGLIRIVVLYPESSLGNFLNMRWLVHIGIISYGLYVFHWPILFVLKKVTDQPVLITLIGGLLTYLTALASYYTIEKYFRDVRGGALAWAVQSKRSIS